MTKLQRILIGILAAQLVLAAIVFWPRQAADAGKPLLDIAAEDVTALTIQDDQGASVVLTKVGDGWVATSAADYPADAAKITPVISKLTAINTGRLVGETTASHTRLQVADDKFVRKVDIQTAAGVKTLYLGSSAGSNTTHVRLAGQNQVYLAGNLATWDIDGDLTAWIDPVYFSVPSADITGFTLVNASGEFAFEKDANGAWTLAGLAAGEALDASKVTSLVSQFSSLRLTKVLGKVDDSAYGLAQPSAALTVQAKSGDQVKTYTLTIGVKDPTDNSYLVKSSESAYYVRVAEYGVKDLVERTRELFMQPTPTAQPTGSAVATPAP